jgi:hypothetical protein
VRIACEWPRSRAAEQRDEVAPSRQRQPQRYHRRPALQGIKTQSKGWTMTASGQTRDLKKAVEAATVSGLIP